jgi:DNA-directed RNA polymerase specialized sigma24 family protein
MDEPTEDMASYSRFVIDTREQLMRALVVHHGPEVGAEALADAYAYAWEHWRRIKVLDNPTGYVLRAADRIGIKRSMRLNRERSTDVIDVQLAPWFDHGTYPDVVAALQSLPRRQSAAALLIHGYGWSYQDVANTLDVPLTTVTNDVARALSRLRSSRALSEHRQTTEGTR